MSAGSAIEWTDCTWNPLTGCTKISAGCQHCYAERMARRLQAMGQPNYAHGFQLALHPHVLQAPLGWKRPHRVFVNSMSDLFHRDVPTEFIASVFDVMRRASWHTYQLLTKRSDRRLELSSALPWPPNVWMGVTVESEAYRFRADHLRRTGALFLQAMGRRAQEARRSAIRGPHLGRHAGRLLCALTGKEVRSGGRSLPRREERGRMPRLWLLDIVFRQDYQD
jgi:protein gp37